MIESLILGVLLLAIVLPLGVFYLTQTKTLAKDRISKFKRMLAVNVSSFVLVFVFATVFLFATGTQAAEQAAVGVTDTGLKLIGAALSTGLAAIGAGIATGQAAASALGALSENEGIMGKALIFVALSEGIVIYGLLVSFMILNS